MCANILPNPFSMGKLKAKRVQMELKKTLKAKERYRWYSAIERLKKRGWTVKDACKEVRVSRSEYYYWHRRVQERLFCSKPGKHLRPWLFEELSRKPRYSPSQIPKEIEEKIVRLRKKTNQGAEYIRFWMIHKYQITLSVTGIYKVLKREGLIKKRRYHSKKQGTVVKRVYLPGEKVQVDTKYVKKLPGKTVYQYSAIDLATGIVYKELYETIGPQESMAFLRNLVPFYPFKIRNIQTDNGLEYTWRLNPDVSKEHPFTTQCRLLGIQHVHIPPASPTFNSHVERTHRVDMEELWRKRRFRSFRSMQKALRAHVLYYNCTRPARSKSWRTPLQFANEQFALGITSLKFPVQNV